MKKILFSFFRDFFGHPVFPVISVLCGIFLIFLTADSMVKPQTNELSDTFKINALRYAASATTSTTTTTTSTTTTSTTTTSTTTSTSTSTSTTTETTTVTEYIQPSYSYTTAGESPNSSFYQDRLVIVGDSIAYGFNAYGYIPYQHNIAAESLGVWNMHNYTFDIGGGAMGIYDAVSYAYSPLYYISMGINDIYTYSADDYAWNIRWIAEEILARVPTATIVVGSITPVSDGNYYTTNDRIREFNSSLEWVINDMQSPQVLYFSTHDVLCDWNTMALSWEYAGGDGLHLNSSAYSAMLNCLFNYLDETSAYEQIITHEESY